MHILLNKYVNGKSQFMELTDDDLHMIGRRRIRYLSELDSGFMILGTKIIQRLGYGDDRCRHLLIVVNTFLGVKDIHPHMFVVKKDLIEYLDKVEKLKILVNKI